MSATDTCKYVRGRLTDMHAYFPGDAPWGFPVLVPAQNRNRP